MCHAALHLSAEALAEEVCDRLSKKGLLKANPSYAYKVREAELVEIFEEANLDGRTLLSIGESRRLEEHLLGVTAGEACAWLDHVISELNEMVQDLEMASAEQAGAIEGTNAGADWSDSDLFETASDGLDSKDLGASNSTASPPRSRGIPRSEAVAARVCTRLVDKGLLKTKPAFVRTDREFNICTLLRKAGLEDAALTAYSDGRSLRLRLQGALNEEACAWLENTVIELVELSQDNDDFDEFDPAPEQKLLVKEEHTGAGVCDTPRSMASCSTCDCDQQIPARKRVSFSAAPAEVFHIVPYSEVYILHPDKFEFDSDGRYVTDD